MRTDLLTQIAVAQSEIEKALAQLSDGDARIPLALQLANLSALRQQATLASPSALSQMQAAIVAAVATAQALTDGTTGKSADAGVTTLAAATAQARHAVQNFVEEYYEKRKFDEFLEFSSDEDERSYRERAKKRLAEIERTLADGTTEGARRAVLLGQEQMRDAKAHGADKSPDFQAQSDELDKAARDIDASLSAVSDAPLRTSDTAEHITTLRRAGVTVADQSGEGHGVTMDASIAQFLARG